MSRPRSNTSDTAATAASEPRSALTYDDLPPEMKEAIQDYLRHTNASLRAAVAEYFEDKAATERRHGKMGTWDVGRVTDMSRLFYERTEFNDAGIAAWDTSSVTTMRLMFTLCGQFQGEGIGALDVSSVRAVWNQMAS